MSPEEQKQWEEGGALLGKLAAKGVFGTLSKRDGRWIVVTWKNGTARAYGGTNVTEAATKALEAQG